MRQRSRCSWNGAVALAAALAASPALAGDSSAQAESESSAKAGPCGSPGEACRIKGYVKAGANPSRSEDPRTARFALPPLLAGVGALGQSAADGLNRGMVYLKVSGDDGAR